MAAHHISLQGVLNVTAAAAQAIVRFIGKQLSLHLEVADPTTHSTKVEGLKPGSRHR